MENLKEKIIKSDSELKKIIQVWRKKNERIVFTNGCFDILHLGHIKLLSESKNLGDRLIVGLNTDESIQILKGADRPINNGYTRSMMLASLFFVDKVVFFSEETPIKLIELICPNVLSKGGDYTINNIVGASKVMRLGGAVKIIPLIKNLSTSELIKKINSSIS